MRAALSIDPATITGLFTAARVRRLGEAGLGARAPDEGEMVPVMQAGMVERSQAGDYVALASKTRPDAWYNRAGKSALKPETPYALLFKTWLQTQVA